MYFMNKFLHIRSIKLFSNSTKLVKAGFSPQKPDFRENLLIPQKS